MTYLEPEDDGPYEAKNEPVVPIDDVVWAHVLQVDFLVLQKSQRFVSVFQTVDAHFPASWLRLKQRR